MNLHFIVSKDLQLSKEFTSDIGEQSNHKHNILYTEQINLKGKMYLKTHEFMLEKTNIVIIPPLKMAFMILSEQMWCLLPERFSLQRIPFSQYCYQWFLIHSMPWKIWFSKRLLISVIPIHYINLSVYKLIQNWYSQQKYSKFNHFNKKKPKL